VRFRIIAFAAVVAALVPALALARPTTTKFVVALAGKYEVPKGAPAGKGTATITISGTKVCWAFTSLSGISKETAAHIHKAPTGKAGPIVVPFGGAYKAKGCTATTAAIAKAIVAHPGAYYVNIHTVKYPAGAVRSQLNGVNKVGSSGGGYGY
jgi:CHRD domain-containing protein